MRNAPDRRACPVNHLCPFNEGLQHHFHAKERGELLLSDSGYTAHNHSPEDIGHMSALSVIPALIPASIDFDSKKPMKVEGFMRRSSKQAINLIVTCEFSKKHWQARPKFVLTVNRRGKAARLLPISETEVCTCY